MGHKQRFARPLSKPSLGASLMVAFFGLPAKAELPAPPPVVVPKVLPPAFPLLYHEVVTGDIGEKSNLPIVVVLHGLGGTPQNLAKLFRRWDTPARVLLPFAPHPYGQGASWFPRAHPVRHTSPDIVTDDLSKATALVNAFLDAIKNAYPMAGKPVITGYSQGGMLAYAVAVRYPKNIAAAVPVAGFLPAQLLPRESPVSGPYPPIIALHGERDPIVYYDAAAEAVEVLKDLKVPAKLFTMRGVGHGISRSVKRRLLQTLTEQLYPDKPRMTEKRKRKKRSG